MKPRPLLNQCFNWLDRPWVRIMLGMNPKGWTNQDEIDYQNWKNGKYP